MNIRQTNTLSALRQALFKKLFDLLKSRKRLSFGSYPVSI